eukprot:4181752-Prymnesium_polylepis.2
MGYGVQGPNTCVNDIWGAGAPHLYEREDEHVAEGREGDDEDDDEGHDGQQVLGDATQQPHLPD